MILKILNIPKIICNIECFNPHERAFSLFCYILFVLFCFLINFIDTFFLSKNYKMNKCFLSSIKALTSSTFVQNFYSWLNFLGFLNRPLKNVCARWDSCLAFGAVPFFIAKLSHYKLLPRRCDKSCVFFLIRDRPTALFFT